MLLAGFLANLALFLVEFSDISFAESPLLILLIHKRDEFVLDFICKSERRIVELNFSFDLLEEI